MMFSLAGHGERPPVQNDDAALKSPFACFTISRIGHFEQNPGCKSIHIIFMNEVLICTDALWKAWF